MQFLSRLGLAVLLLLPASLAHAGSGPWTMSEDDLSLWVGLSHSRWTRFVGGAGSGSGSSA